MELLKKFLPGASEITYENITDVRRELSRRIVEDYNRTPGTLSEQEGDYDCPKCLNRGRIAALREDGRYGFYDCECQPIRKSIRLMKESGLESVIRDQTFDRFLVKADWQKAIKEGAMDYARTAEGWLLFCGQPGCGKSHLCTAVCREQLLQGKPVRYMLWVAESGKLKNPELPERDAKMEALKNTPILYIDDLFKPIRSADGSTQPSTADIRLAFELLNHRYLNRLPTILSTERLPGELLKIDQALGSRILEMAADHCYTVRPDISRNQRLTEV